MIPIALRLLLFAFVGLGLGLVHFAALRRGIRLHLSAGFDASTITFHVARLLLTTALWVGIARAGEAAGLLAALVGFLVARPIATSPRRTA